MRRHSRLWGQIANILFFYIGWLITALEAAEGHAWTGPLVVAFIVALHFYFVRDVKAEAIIVIVISLAGTMMDTFYSVIGFIHYHAGYESIPWLAPPWITAMWALFATTVNHAFEWMHNRWPIAALFGACGGTLTYFGAMRLGVGSFLINHVIAAIILAVIWAIAFPLTLEFSVRIQKKAG